MKVGIKKNVITKQIDKLLDIIMDKNWEELNENKEAYKSLHSIQGGIKAFHKSVEFLIDDPESLHKLAVWVRDIEWMIHKEKIECQKCLRRKTILEFIEHNSKKPGFLTLLKFKISVIAKKKEIYPLISFIR